MTVEFYAGSQLHYVNHLAPIYLALPDAIRGKFAVIRHSPAERRAQELGISPVPFRQYSSDVLVCVASYEDYRATKPAKVVFVNHGVGQTYVDLPMGSYSGGKGRDRTVLFLCTSQRDADINQRAYPEAVSYPVGVPYLDPIPSIRQTNLMEIEESPDFNPRQNRVYLSFHANIQACPETRWAVDWVKPALTELVTQKNLDLLGHYHPRAEKQLRLYWQKLGIPVEPDWWRVLQTANCYVIDNSSSGYEAAAIGIPTVWWNPPFYRRDVHHGLRFWEAIPGVEVNDPMDITGAIELALLDPPYMRQKRDAALSIAYGDASGQSLIDGHCTDRAVEAICRLTLGCTR